jgi:hypothetical protein
LDKASFPEGTSSVASLFPERELTWADSLEKPCLITRPPLGKDILPRVHPNSHDRHYIALSLLDKKTTYASESEYLEGPNPVAASLLDNPPFLFYCRWDKGASSILN